MHVRSYLRHRHEYLSLNTPSSLSLSCPAITTPPQPVPNLTCTVFCHGQYSLATDQCCSQVPQPYPVLILPRPVPLLLSKHQCLTSPLHTSSILSISSSQPSPLPTLLLHPWPSLSPSIPIHSWPVHNSHSSPPSPPCQVPPPPCHRCLSHKIYYYRLPPP